VENQPERDRIARLIGEVMRLTAEHRADVERWNKANTEANAEIAALREERDERVAALARDLRGCTEALTISRSEVQRLTEALQTARKGISEAQRETLVDFVVAYGSADKEEPAPVCTLEVYDALKSALAALRTAGEGK
jgi:hypothetical protein